jgi:hypothetical protein
MSIIPRALELYNNKLENFPIQTKMISSGVVGGLGDILIQLVQSGGNWKALDLRRLIVFITVASLYIAPVINIWFNWLSKLSFIKRYCNCFNYLFLFHFLTHKQKVFPI